MIRLKSAEKSQLLKLDSRYESVIKTIEENCKDRRIANLLFANLDALHQTYFAQFIGNKIASEKESPLVDLFTANSFEVVRVFIEKFPLIADRVYSESKAYNPESINVASFACSVAECKDSKVFSSFVDNLGSFLKLERLGLQDRLIDIYEIPFNAKNATEVENLAKELDALALSADRVSNSFSKLGVNPQPTTAAPAKTKKAIEEGVQVTQ
jgi:hypothetical protein